VVAGSTNKKVVVRRFERETIHGFVHPPSYLRPDGVEVLSPAGNILILPYAEVKAVFFVRDFEDAVASDQRVFNTRPRMSGIWVRMRFRDGEVMDGVMPNNLLQIENQGFMVAPPSASASHQRVFVPRAALADLQVLGVIGSPLKPPPKAKVPEKKQIELFER
jgi:hypothetical protein